MASLYRQAIDRIATLESQRLNDGVKAAAIIHELRVAVHDLEFKSTRWEQQSKADSKWSRQIARAYTNLCPVCGATAMVDGLCTSCDQDGWAPISSW